MINALFTITVLELFIGGGGRLTELGSVTVRMVLFAACLYVGLLSISLRRGESKQLRLAYVMVLFYLLVHVPGVMWGAANGVDPGDILTEFQQSLYWLAAPFFALALQSVAMVKRTATLVQFAGLCLAFGYIAVL